MVKTTRSFAHNTHLVLFDQNTHRPMYTADFDGDGERSIVLPVRSLVHKWILSERPHQGVYFKLSSDNRVATNSSVQVIEGSGFQKRRNRPLLIVKTLPTKTKLFEDMESLINPRKLIQRSRRPRAVVRDEGPCSRRSMTVQFRKHLNIKDIIFPRSFESYRCGGHCKFPLDNKVNPTRYAIVLAILYSRFGLAGGGKEPCCVPTKLRKVTVFVKRQGHVKIQPYDDMIVEECGCRWWTIRVWNLILILAGLSQTDVSCPHSAWKTCSKLCHFDMVRWALLCCRYNLCTGVSKLSFYPGALDEIGTVCAPKDWYIIIFMLWYLT